MSSFVDAASAFPTAIFSVLLVAVLAYWLLALLGVVDADHGHLHLHVDGAADAPDLGTLAGVATALGLNGVPLSIAATLVVLFAWTLSCLGAMWLLPLVPADSLRLVGGGILGLASLSAAVAAAGRAVRPLRPLFFTHAAIHNVALVGQTCKVLTQTVDEKMGRAEVAQRGANLNIRVWAPSPNRLTRGASARIVAYEDATARYRIEADS
ncbi:ubiquinone biosynthesis protein [Caenimonas sedimenti]|uniref:Ubiquinone biosynthesis protein n=1 Tax=Caenimonas sedimenti TaxID=2596921 RepID=A0A562ZR34_9BURK|nr:ubiquinone biosynthesis protein [Caenimonas sedimenti]TWO70847.1 ubiquinone biosynthesis protein [Caenimonas sedimenti]